jgi:hypothetical protein
MVSKMISGATRTKAVELIGFQPSRITRVRGARQSKKLMRGIKEIYAAPIVFRAVTQQITKLQV